MLFVKLNVETNNLPVDLRNLKIFPKIFLYLKNKKIFPIEFNARMNTIELSKFSNLKK